MRSRPVGKTFKHPLRNQKVIQELMLKLKNDNPCDNPCSVWSVLKHSNTPPFEIFLSITDLFSMFSGDYHLFERLFIQGIAV